ncbi:MAG: hypothetical protein WC816_10425 [Sphingomonas sp.]|jgi:hypothetical protein
MAYHGADVNPDPGLNPAFTIRAQRAGVSITAWGSGMESAGFVGTEHVQEDLSRRVALMGLGANRRDAGALAQQVETIRRLALANRMYPAASVAHALEMAIGRGERGPLIDGWLAILVDAIGCDRNDTAACDTYAAACTVRYAG